MMYSMNKLYLQVMVCSAEQRDIVPCQRCDMQKITANDKVGHVMNESRFSSATSSVCLFVYVYLCDEMTIWARV